MRPREAVPFPPGPATAPTSYLTLLFLPLKAFNGKKGGVVIGREADAGCDPVTLHCTDCTALTLALAATPDVG